MSEPTVFFFDGVCGFCNRNVDFLLRADKNKVFKFVPLQDPKAIQILTQAGQPKPDFSSSILLRGGKFYYKSDAYFEAMKILGFPWSLIGILKIFPMFLRDAIYDIIAANRHRIFGKLETCRLPTPEERERFL